MADGNLTPIRQLELEGRLLWDLAQAHVEHIETLADLTYSELKAKIKCTPQELTSIFAKVDFFYDRQSHSKLVCPALPQACWPVETQYLELEERIIRKLEQMGFDTLKSLAFKSKEDLKAKGLQVLDLLETEFALSSFLDAYRKGKIILNYIEEEPENLYAEELKEQVAELDLPALNTSGEDLVPPLKITPLESESV